MVDEDDETGPHHHHAHNATASSILRTHPIPNQFSKSKYGEHSSE
jgi:hypothetical protein